eukprot:s295_g31.t1
MIHADTSEGAWRFLEDHLNGLNNWRRYGRVYGGSCKGVSSQECHVRSVKKVRVSIRVRGLHLVLLLQHTPEGPVFLTPADPKWYPGFFQDS